MGLTVKDFQPDPILTEIAMRYGTGGGFAQDRILPSRGVQKDSFKYMTWAMRDFIQGAQFNTKRAPGAPSPQMEGPKGTWLTGNVTERSLEAELPDEVRNNAANPTAVEDGVIRKIMNVLRMQVEIDVKTKLYAVGSSDSPTVKWDASSGTITIEADWRGAKEEFIKKCGFEPNLAIVPPAIANVMAQNSAVRTLVQYTDQTLLVDGSLPAKVWGVPILIPGALVDSANPGAAADVGRVWSTDTVTFLYVNPAAASNPMEMTSIMRFYSAAQVGQAWAARSWRDAHQSKQLTWYQAATFDEIILVADAVYHLTDCLT